MSISSPGDLGHFITVQFLSSGPSDVFCVK